jgi:hypothetical protein
MSTTPQLPNLGGLSLKPTGGKTSFEKELEQRRKRIEKEKKALERQKKGVDKAPPKPRVVAPPRGRLPVERPPAAAPVQEAEDDDDDELFAEPFTEPDVEPYYDWKDDDDDLFAEPGVPPKSAEEILRDMIRRSEQDERRGAAATPAPVVPASPASIPEDQMDSPEPYVPSRQDDGLSAMWAEFLRRREEMRAQEEANRAAMKEQKRGVYAAPADPTPDRNAERQRQRERERAERERDRGTSPLRMPDAYDLEDDLNTLPER